MVKINDYSLYLVTSEKFSCGRSTFEVVASAIRGGVSVVQMREKKKTPEGLAALGIRLAKICRESGVMFVVNDDPLMARDLRADGVHLGQKDLDVYPIECARKIMGRNRIIGVSTHSFTQFERFNESDCDYIAFGPLFQTRTKDFYIGMKDINMVVQIAKKPVVFIGGINLSNIERVLAEGARNIAVISAITGAEDIARAAQDLKAKIKDARVACLQ